jgi:DNA polymerase III subunit epsilon
MGIPPHSPARPNSLTWRLYSLILAQHQLLASSTPLKSFAMLDKHLVFLDLETTGVNPLRDRIIEIGLCEVVDGRLLGEWSSLINPRKSVSPFIEQFTGIANGMLATAPFFEAIAEELLERLQGKVLVAHNARFDFGFLKNEFLRLEMPFQPQLLCTVKLSRELFPQQRGHGLDAIIARHALQVCDRHRALGDARLVWAFVQKIASELPPEALAKAVQSQLKQPSLPPHLPKEQIEALPAAVGVYLFYGENDTVLYVGKSVDIRARVLSHFAGDHRGGKGMRLSQQVRRIEAMETAGELGALLLEARLVKKLVPIHNRQLRRTRDLFALRLLPGKAGHLLPAVVALKSLAGEGLEGLFGIFRSRREADQTLREIILEQGLCTRVLGLERGEGACFNVQIKKCRGACIGREPLPLHQLRLLNALGGLKLRAWPFRGVVGIREQAPGGERTDIHVFNAWCHLGTADSEERLWEILDTPCPLPFDLDSYKILTRYLDREESRSALLDLSRPPLAAAGD